MASGSAHASWVSEGKTRRPTGWSHTPADRLSFDSASKPKEKDNKSASASGSSTPSRGTGPTKRTTNKRLRPIFEASGLAYGDDVSDEEVLADRLEHGMLIVRKGIRSIMHEIRRSREVDLCFLLDVTGSMDPHINGVYDSIGKVVTAIMAPIIKGNATSAVAANIRLAFVGYRDYGDDPQFEVLQFVDNVSEFRDFVGKVRANGGLDAPEDVFGGLQRAISLDWSSNAGTRVLFHVADSPCHGKKYHNLNGDRYADGDPDGRSEEDLFREMRKRNIQYYFGKINTSTDKMIEVFSRAYGAPIEDFDVKKIEAITASVLSAVSTSIDRGIRRSSRSITTSLSTSAEVLKKYSIDPEEPNWAMINVTEGIFMEYEIPRSLSDIINDTTLKKIVSSGVFVQIAPSPFAEGEERLAYYGRDVSKQKRATHSIEAGVESKSEAAVDIVLKDYKRKLGAETQPALRHEIANEVQTVAAFFAEEFQRRLPPQPENLHIKFLKVKTFSALTVVPRYLTCERRLTRSKITKDFIRFSNNVSYTILEDEAVKLGVDKKYVQMLLAFSHFTFHVSDGYLIVVDLQGIVAEKEGIRVIELTDPAIHCRNQSRFGFLNLSLDGMKTFFNYHECNDYCKALGLKAPSEEFWTKRRE